MGNFFSSLFSSSKTTSNEETQAKNEAKNFDILKYDGIRALQCCGKQAYGIKCLREALNIREDVEAMAYLVSGYTMTQQLDKALETNDRLIEIDPTRVEHRLSRINLLFMLDRIPEVITDCTKNLAEHPDLFILYFLRAKAARMTGNAMNALADLTKTIQLQEDYAPAYAHRGELLFRMRQGKEAVADVSKAIELNPEEESYFMLRAHIHEQLGELAEARADYEQVTTLNPFHEEALVAVGRLLTQEGKCQEAIQYFDELIEMSKAYSERGRAKNTLGDTKGAFADLKKAIELDPHGEEAQRFNGQHSNFSQR